MNTNTSKGITIKDLAETAILAALVFVVTRFIQIPIPLGYFNIGNTVILSGCLLLPFPYGVLAAAIGSALADLTSFPVYTIPTLIIKAVFPIIFYWICGRIRRSEIKNSSYPRSLIAAAISTLIPLFGYTLTGMILYGGFAAGLAQFPGLVLEYVANLILFAALYYPVIRIKGIVTR